jgi:hypothetical protein
MSGSNRQDLLKRYRGRVEEAQKWRTKEEYDSLWKRLVDLYRGKHFSNWEAMSGGDRIAVNIVFATINVIAPSISVNHPKLVVWSQKNEDSTKAVIVEAAVNYWWKRYGYQPEVALAVKDFLVIGHGWLKVGWRYVEEQKAAQPMSQGGDDATPAGVDEKAADEPDSESADNEPEFEVSEDRPFVERVSPLDIFVDPEAKTLAEAKWIAQKIVKPIEEVRRDKKYRAAGRRALKPDSQLNPDWRGVFDDNDPNADDVKRCTLWEFYDMQQGTMCVFSNLGDELLLDPIKQPYQFGHPFVMLRNYEVPDYFYPMGDVEALEPLQLELDKTRTQMMNHRKRYDRKWLFRQSAFDPAGINALNTDQDNMLVPVADETTPLAEVMHPIPQTPVAPEFYNYLESIEGDIDRVSGVSEYQQGQAPEIRRTATEASMIQDATNSRVAEKLVTVEHVMGSIAHRIIQLAQQYMTQDQEVRIMGKNGFPIWTPFTRDDVQGDFDFEVEAGSTQPLNEQNRRQQALQLLQTFTPYASSGLVNVHELIRYTLAYGFQIKQPDRFLMGAAPQGEQHKSPHQSVIETMNYKDAPPDIQRQMEQAAGFQPSQLGGSSPMEGHLAKMAPTVLGQQAQGVTAASQQQAQAQQQKAQHVHEASLKHEDRQHQQQMAAVQAQQQAAMAAQQHQQGMEAADQQAGHQASNTMLQAAMQPDEGPEPTEGSE